ncbi:hypothetical protein EOS_02460 [Caballeronia mineralivorans PML1(12)]|uniref:Uncharacterized protein n=1 Tax=Caballeronia mineralivorans PML1(12) TaxID=908627 RepID=A0A0J1G6A8_9BURK|nr:hypothetical protein [Caballeronia mineralivorans]KLU27798.1 hypothetical protein EOS_02460 [Caballeronia mineralivorans PML1(12)]
MSDENKSGNPRAFSRMRLRDYFAGQALAGDMSEETFSSDAEDEFISERVQLYYRIADAMLMQRIGKGKEDEDY